MATVLRLLPALVVALFLGAAVLPEVSAAATATGGAHGGSEIGGGPTLQIQLHGYG